MNDNPTKKFICDALLELAIRWDTESKIHEAAGGADCGTGSDVPYALADKCREHARELEKIAYCFSKL